MFTHTPIFRPARGRAWLAAALISSALIPAAPALAGPFGDVEDPFLIRLRGLVVAPDEGGDVSPIGGDVDIETQVVPELDISYFFTENIAVELILATTPHDVAVNNSSIGDVDLGDVWLLPPTLTLQYHFTPRSDTFRPYIGAGVNYTFFYEQDDGPVAESVNYDNGFGFALQAGVDIPVGDAWFLNADVKRVWLDTDVTVDAGTLDIVKADVDIDPWIIGLGVGRRF